MEYGVRKQLVISGDFDEDFQSREPVAENGKPESVVVEEKSVNSQTQVLSAEKIGDNVSAVEVSSTPDSDSDDAESVDASDATSETAKSPERSRRRIFEEKITHHDVANAIARGLVVADRTGKVGYWSSTYFKVQEVISGLRRGQSWRSAAKANRVPEALVAELLTLGGLPPAQPQLFHQWLLQVLLIVLK